MCHICSASLPNMLVALTMTPAWERDYHFMWVGIELTAIKSRDTVSCWTQWQAQAEGFVASTHQVRIQLHGVQPRQDVPT